MFDSATDCEMPALPILREKLSKQRAMELRPPVYDIPQYEHKSVQALLLHKVQVGFIADGEA